VERVRQAVQQVVDYAELVIAAGLATYVSALALLDEITTRGLIQATVALLIALSIAVIRERSERRAVRDQISRTADLLKGDKPWQVLNEEVAWQICELDGSLAVATAEKQLQFMQDEVLSVYEYQYNPPARGEVVDHVCEGGPVGGPMVPLPIIQSDFPGPDLRFYRLISLQGVRGRGEIMMLESRRTLRNHFLDSQEVVSKEVSVPTSRVRMCVNWPEGRKPTAIWTQRSNEPPTSVGVSTLARVHDRQKDWRHWRGRMVGWRYDYLIQDPRLGERITIRWIW
jgi:hypothetical protein